MSAQLKDNSRTLTYKFYSGTTETKRNFPSEVLRCFKNTPLISDKWCGKNRSDHWPSVIHASKLNATILSKREWYRILDWEIQIKPIVLHKRLEPFRLLCLSQSSVRPEIYLCNLVPSFWSTIYDFIVYEGKPITKAYYCMPCSLSLRHFSYKWSLSTTDSLNETLPMLSITFPRRHWHCLYQT